MIYTYIIYVCVYVCACVLCTCIYHVHAYILKHIFITMIKTCITVREKKYVAWEKALFEGNRFNCIFF